MFEGHAICLHSPSSSTEYGAERNCEHELLSPVKVAVAFTGDYFTAVAFSSLAASCPSPGALYSLGEPNMLWAMTEILPVLLLVPKIRHPASRLLHGVGKGGPMPLGIH